MKQFYLSLVGVVASFMFLGFVSGGILGDSFILSVKADTDVIYSNINLTNDPHANFKDGVFQGSVWTDTDLSIVVGESSVLNEWDEFEIWYQKSIGNDEWIIFPIDMATYQYLDLIWDADGHRDTLSCVLTDADFASSTSVNICEFIVYCIDYYGM